MPLFSYLGGHDATRNNEGPAQMPQHAHGQATPLRTRGLCGCNDLQDDKVVGRWDTHDNVEALEVSAGKAMAAEGAGSRSMAFTMVPAAIRHLVSCHPRDALP